MFALIGNLDFTELVVIAAVALMAFGKNLPQVAMRAAVQVARARRALTAMWREAGLEEELRRVRRDVEREANLPKVQAPSQMMRDAGRRYMDDIEKDLNAEPESPTPRPPSHPTRARGQAAPAEAEADLNPAPIPDPEPGHGEPAPDAESGPQAEPGHDAEPGHASPPAGVDLTPRPVQRQPLPGDDRRETNGSQPE